MNGCQTSHFSKSKTYQKCSNAFTSLSKSKGSASVKKGKKFIKLVYLFYLEQPSPSLKTIFLKKLEMLKEQVLKVDCRHQIKKDFSEYCDFMIGKIKI
jgi:hypothetical protein